MSGCGGTTPHSSHWKRDGDALMCIRCYQKRRNLKQKDKAENDDTTDAKHSDDDGSDEDGFYYEGSEE